MFLRHLSPAASAAIAVSCLAAGGGNAWAQDQVTVTATRNPTRVSELVAEVTVIDRAQLDRATGRTLVELLAQSAGLQFSSNGGLGKTASLFIRGLEARHTLLLVDGVRVGSATVGSPSLDNLPLEAVDRIEVVRGPLSSLYGNGAFGGVIQVFTRRATEGLSGHAQFTAGSHQFGQAAGGVGFGNRSFDLTAQVQHTDVHGVSASNPRVPFGSYNDDRDGFRQTAGTLRLGWNPHADWRVELLSLRSVGLTRIDDGPGADARAELRNGITALSVRGQPMPGWRTRVTLSDSTDAYDTLASASPFTDLGTIESRTRQLGWENSVATPVGTAFALVERTQEKVSRPGAPFTVSSRDIDALALGLNGSAAGHAWQASVRRDHNSQFGGITTGALAYGYAVTPAWRVGASYGTSQVLPSFNQLYYPGFGSPDLQPEEGRHGELSLQWTAGVHRVRAAWYDYRYRGFISSGPQPVNLPRVHIDGVTLAYEGQWLGVDLGASLDHNDPRNDTVGSANFGKQLPRRAKDALRLSADWATGAWRLGASLAAFAHRYDNAANTTRLAGYATLDLRAEWALSRDLKLALKLNNVGDKAYETALGYDQPRREGFVSLRWAFR